MKKVIVGMSGGVDSSVAAFLLKKNGYDVIGIFMKNWDQATNNDILGNPNLDSGICPEEQDYLDAKAVCDKLNIPLKRVDFSKEYWDKVFSYFLDEYKKGRTPNPDLFCNKYIKKLTKSEVRKIAKENNLVTADKKDSTGICFIGKRHFKEFLTNYIPNKKGNIIDINTKEIVGTHVGSVYYTIGQNKNLDLSGAKKKYFVCKKDVKKNVLYVTSSDNESLLMTKKCSIEELNWISPSKCPEVVKCRAKIRYRSSYVDVILNTKTLKVVFNTQVKAITPGQAIVFYLENECIAGAIIQ